ncbi:hypothetical protein PIB30_042939, partial [Stylosanthes scabra]|nr:hypothetical protein [Stylosanthes scabra]
MFRITFDALGFKDGDLKTHQPGVMGLGYHFIKPDGSIELPNKHRKGKFSETTMAVFVVLQDSTAYNVFLDRKTINDLSEVIYTKFLVMKYEVDMRTLMALSGSRRERGRR